MASNNGKIGQAAEWYFAIFRIILYIRLCKTCIGCVVLILFSFYSCLCFTLRLNTSPGQLCLSKYHWIKRTFVARSCRFKSCFAILLFLILKQDVTSGAVKQCYHNSRFPLSPISPRYGTWSASVSLRIRRFTDLNQIRLILFFDSASNWTVTLCSLKKKAFQEPRLNVNNVLSWYLRSLYASWEFSY